MYTEQDLMQTKNTDKGYISKDIYYVSCFFSVFNICC
ncbi:MAG: hypothetical protein ACFWUE_08650 [Xylanivirga thermophila]